MSALNLRNKNNERVADALIRDTRARNLAHMVGDLSGYGATNTSLMTSAPADGISAEGNRLHQSGSTCVLRRRRAPQRRSPAGGTDHRLAVTGQCATPEPVNIYET
jgi:hypothetical protein